MLARAPLHAPRHIARPWAVAAFILLAIGLFVHGDVVITRLAFPEPLAGEESIALSHDATAIPAHLGPLHALLLLIVPPWLPGIRLLLGLVPLAGAAVLIEWCGRHLLGIPWTGIAWTGIVLLLWPALGAIDAASAAPLLTFAALFAWRSAMEESFPGLRAPLVAVALTTALLLHPAGLALLALPFLLAREDRRQAVAGILALLAAAGLVGAGLLPHASTAAKALLDPEAFSLLAAAILTTLPLALPGLAAPFLLVNLERAGPRDPESGLALVVALLILGGLATAPLLGASALAPAALVGLSSMAFLLGGLAMGRSETPLLTAILGGTLLVAGILSADLPLRRAAMHPMPGDMTQRAALLKSAACLGTHTLLSPHFSQTLFSFSPRLETSLSQERWPPSFCSYLPSDTRQTSQTPDNPHP